MATSVTGLRTSVKHGHYFLYHIYSFYNHFISTLKLAAELDALVIISLSNRNLILHVVHLQLHSVFNDTALTTVNPTQFLGFCKKLYLVEFSKL